MTETIVFQKKRAKHGHNSDKNFTSSLRGLQNYSSSYFKKGFSVAEAMITLLIVSLALAAMAPIMSKKITSSSASVDTLPPGAVIAFDLAGCPSGWAPLTNRYNGSEGAFIRNIGDNALQRGAVQLDASPNLTFQFALDDVMASHGFGGNAGQLAGNGSTVSLKASTDDRWNGRIAMFNASRASASYGRDNTIEVRPKNIALLYCRKN